MRRTKPNLGRLGKIHRAADWTPADISKVVKAAYMHGPEGRTSEKDEMMAAIHLTAGMNLAWRKTGWAEHDPGSVGPRLRSVQDPGRDPSDARSWEWSAFPRKKKSA